MIDRRLHAASVVVREMQLLATERTWLEYWWMLCKNMYICGKYTHLGILLILIKEWMIIMKQGKQPNWRVEKHTQYKAINYRWYIQNTRVEHLHYIQASRQFNTAIYWHIMTTKASKCGGNNNEQIRCETWAIMIRMLDKSYNNEHWCQ